MTDINRDPRRAVREHPVDDPSSTPGADGGSGLAALRRETEELLRRSDEIIERALSEDSRIYLESCQQEGGQ